MSIFTSYGFHSRCCFFYNFIFLSVLCLGYTWPSFAVVTTEDSSGIINVSTEKFDKEQTWPIPCSSHYEEDDEANLLSSGSSGKSDFCRPRKGGMCDRVVKDNFLTSEEISTLVSMADRGMNGYLSQTKNKRNMKPPSGPTIMDVNSGYVLPSGSSQPRSIYSKGQIYTKDEYEMYRRVTTNIKKFIESKFGLSKLYFTAPTFITREIGDSNWHAKTLHDEYWHVHSDKNNTKHYDYSGLIYLSEQGKDFTGGSLEFYDYSNLDCSAFVDDKNPGPCKVQGSPTMVVAPVPGRLIVFGSGRENPHRVNIVNSGTRYVLSFWFTCDESRVFEHFLDGKMHQQYKRKRKHKRKHRKKKESPSVKKKTNTVAGKPKGNSEL